jgi:alkanesulfonate monooxygenase SsuD/methylene tetrahydromethanopterin reductase-like flavin-dependent oxidoreductase (luciferase family)
MANTARPVGILLLGDLAPAKLADYSRHIEAAGFSELWLAEDYFLLSGFAGAAIALQATSRIKVAIGAVANRVRHPAVTAMEATTLAGAFPGRFDSLGIGHGVPYWMRQMKLYPKSVLTSLREAVTGVKRLVRGETITEDGDYYSYDNVTLAHLAPDLKVLTAVVQAKSLELTAKIADGLILSVLAGPMWNMSRRSSPSIGRRAGRRRAFRSSPMRSLASITTARRRAAPCGRRRPSIFTRWAQRR